MLDWPPSNVKVDMGTNIKKVVSNNRLAFNPDNPTTLINLVIFELLIFKKSERLDTGNV